MKLLSFSKFIPLNINATYVGKQNREAMSRPFRPQSSPKPPYYQLTVTLNLQLCGLTKLQCEKNTIGASTAFEDHFCFIVLVFKH